MARKKRDSGDDDLLFDEIEMEGQGSVDDTPHDSEKSRSQQKREMLARRDLGEALVELSAARLAKIPLSAATLDAVRDGQRFTRRALKRQLTRIARLMSEFDDEAEIRKALENLYQPHRDEVRRLHEAEQWRDALIAGDHAVMEMLVARFPMAERQHLRQLARNANKEQAQQKPPKSARLLYQYLHNLLEDESA